MKYLLLLVILAVVVLAFFGRRRQPPPAPPNQREGRSARPGPQTMVACAHCGVHLPQADARMDAAGRAYCSDAHRLLGPR